MTPAEKRNEHRKLAANWANTIATAVMTAGTFIPIAQFIYGILPQGTNLGLIYGSAVVCIAAGLLIHLTGHWFLGDLE